MTGDVIDPSWPLWNLTEPNGAFGPDEETVVYFSDYKSVIDGSWNNTFIYVCECDHRRVTKTFTLH